MHASMRAPIRIRVRTRVRVYMRAYVRAHVGVGVHSSCAFFMLNSCTAYRERTFESRKHTLLSTALPSLLGVASLRRTL